MKKITLSILSLLCFWQLNAQNRQFQSHPSDEDPKRSCGTEEAMEQHYQKYPGSRELQQQQLNESYQKQFLKKGNDNEPTALVTIPVVFHVVYNTGLAADENIPDYRLSQQIKRLNEDFTATNGDIGSVPAAFQSLIGNCQFNFCLATIDPNGQPTTGITRTATSTAGFSTNDNVKHGSSGGKDAWDEYNYLNIWVCNLNGGLLGYAKMSAALGSGNDGVVLLYTAVGNTTGSYNMGRTGTHEIGHYFGMQHIWMSPGCGNDDGISDTPTQDDQSFGCPTYPKTDACQTSSPGIMFMNYMDYCNDACMQMFSAGQVAVMQSTVNGARVGLKNSIKCGTANAPVADFTADNTVITAGQSVNFYDLCTNVPTTYSWTFTGATPNTSTAQNPININYPTTGQYDVCLTATNAGGSNQKCKTQYIIVNPATASCDTGSNWKSTYALGLYKPTSGWGYIFGTNYYDDRAKAEYFGLSPSPNKKIIGALIYFRKAKGGNANASVSVKVYDNTGAGNSPGVVKSTETVLLNSITPDAWHPISFTNYPTITTPYFLSVGFKANGAPQDTIAIAQSAQNQATTNTAWEQYNDGSWYSFEGSWGFKSAGAIKAVICPPAGTNETMLDVNTKIYPNPGNGILNVEIALLQEQNYTVNVYNAVGQLVASQKQNKTPYGNFVFDLSNKDNGIYFVEVRSNDEVSVQRFVLNK